MARTGSKKIYNNIINVSSLEQSGGITAGVVNLGTAQRELSESDKTKLIENLPKDAEIVISVNGTENESRVLGYEIKDFLASEGYKTQGVNTIFGFKPFKNIIVEKKEDKKFVVFIGSK